jgi:hypothetical protein
VFSAITIQICILPTMHKGSPFSTSHNTYLLSFDNTLPTRYEVISHCGFECISLMSRDAELLFMYLLVICMSSLEKCLSPLSIF